MCCPHTDWSMVKFLGARPPNEDEHFCACNHTGSHLSHEGQGQLSRTLRHQHGFRWLLRSQIGLWCGLGTQTSTWPFGRIRTIDLLSGRRDNGFQHGFRWLLMSLISAWSPGQQSLRASPRYQAMVLYAYIHMDLKLYHGLGPQHGAQIPT